MSFDILGDDGGVMGVTGFVGLFIGVCGDVVMVWLEKPTSVIGPLSKL